MEKEELKAKFREWCEENKGKVWFYRPQLMTAERAVNVTDIIDFFDSLPVEAGVMLPINVFATLIMSLEKSLLKGIMPHLKPYITEEVKSYINEQTKELKKIFDEAT